MALRDNIAISAMPQNKFSGGFTIMKRSKVIVAITVFMLAVVCCGTSFAKERLIRYKASKGEQTKYKMNMHGETTIYVEDQTQVTLIDNEMLLTQRVTEFDKKKSMITFQTRIDSGKMNINGVASPLPMIGQVLQTKMLTNGEVLSSIGAANQSLDNMQLVFPEKPVKKGSTWKTEIPANTQVPVPLIMRYKAIAFEKYKGRNCVKLATSIKSGKKSEIEGMSLELDAKGRIYFDVDKGQMVSNRVNSDMRMVLKRVIGGKNTSIITRKEMKVRLEIQ